MLGLSSVILLSCPETHMRSDQLPAKVRKYYIRAKADRGAQTHGMRPVTRLQ
jgi:hypothetical protein